MSRKDDVLQDRLEDLDAEIVEDLDVDEDADDVAGGTSLGCRDEVR